MSWIKFMVVNIILVLVYLILVTGVLNSPEPGFIYDFKEQLKFNEVVSVSQDAVIVVGAVKGERYEEGSNAFVAKINTAGEIIWSHSFGGTGDDEFHNIKQTADGFVLVGSNAEALDLSTAAYVVKIDQAGTKKWEKIFAKQFNSVFYDLVVNSNGDLVLAGEVEYSTSEDDLNTNAYVVKIDGQGAKKWTKKLGGDNFTSAQAIEGNSKNGYYIAGYTNNQEGQKSWLAKLKEDQEEWSKSYFANGSSAFYDLEQLESEQLIAVGEANNKHSSGYIVQLNQDGEKTWDRLVNGKNNSYSTFYTVTEISGEEIVLGGVVSAPLKFGNLNSISYKDVMYSVVMNQQSQKIKVKKFAEKNSGSVQGSAKINGEEVALVGKVSQYEVDCEGYLVILER